MRKIKNVVLLSWYSEKDAQILVLEFELSRKEITRRLEKHFTIALLPQKKEKKKNSDRGLHRSRVWVHYVLLNTDECERSGSANVCENSETNATISLFSQACSSTLVLQGALTGSAWRTGRGRWGAITPIVNPFWKKRLVLLVQVTCLLQMYK